MPDQQCTYTWSDGHQCAFSAGHRGIHSLAGTPITTRTRTITIDESVWELPRKQDAAFLRTLGYLAWWGHPNPNYARVALHGSAYDFHAEIYASYCDAVGANRMLMGAIKRTPESEWEFHT